MNKIILALSLVLLLGACSTIDRIEDRVRPVIEQANDDALDRAHNLMCNDTYRAEKAFMERHNIPAETFMTFCGRDNGEPR